MRNNLLASFSSTWPYASLPEGDAQCLCVTRRTCFLFFSGATLSNRCLRDFAARAACILINSNLGPDQGWSKNKDISPDSTPSSQHAAISREGRGRECAMNCIDWFFFLQCCCCWMLWHLQLESSSFDDGEPRQQHMDRFNAILSKQRVFFSLLLVTRQWICHEKDGEDFNGIRRVSP